MCPTAVVDHGRACTHCGAELRVSRPLSGHDDNCVVAQALILPGILEGETRSQSASLQRSASCSQAAL